MTLTLRLKQHAEYLGQRSFISNVNVQTHGHTTHKETHTGPVAQPGLLKWNIHFTVR